MTPVTAEPGVVELDRAEGRTLVERQARELLGMSLEEFVRAYDGGELDVEAPGVLEVAVLVPFARQNGRGGRILRWRRSDVLGGPLRSRSCRGAGA